MQSHLARLAATFAGVLFAAGPAAVFAFHSWSVGHDSSSPGHFTGVSVNRQDAVISSSAMSACNYVFYPGNTPVYQSEWVLMTQDATE